MNSIIYVKKSKPYLLSKKFEEGLIFNLSYNYELGEKMILSHDDRYQYVNKNQKVICAAEIDVKEINLDKMSNEEKEKLKNQSGLSLQEIRKKLKNGNIGQALYFKNIQIFSKSKNSVDYYEHKRDKFLKISVEREVFAPIRDKKVFLKGDLLEKNPLYLIVLSSQETFDLIEENISVIIRNGFKI